MFTNRNQALKQWPLDLEQLFLHEVLQLLSHESMAHLLAKEIFFDKGL